MVKNTAKRGLLRRFLRSEKGNVALLGTVVMIPALALMGGAVDYARTQNARAELSATLDGAVLAAMRKYSLDNSTDYQQVIDDFVTVTLESSGRTPALTDINIHNVNLSGEGELSAEVSATVQTSFINLLGFSEMEVSAQSAAQVGGAKLEVALVLDNTGSMRGSKLDDLKESATELVEALLPDGQDDKVKVALVPFAKYVNIGMDNRNESGLDIPEDWDHTYTERERIRNCDMGNHTGGRNGGSGSRGNGHNHGHGTSPGDNDPDGDCFQDVEYVDSYKWWGCMGSREHDLNVFDTGYNVGVPGLMSIEDNCQVKPMTRLTDDKAYLLGEIDNMMATGNTYIPSGLAWGWRAVSDQAPFADGVAYDDQTVKKVVVLMTDGDNTVSMQQVDDMSTSRNEGPVHNHEKSGGNSADNYTAELCENIKAQGIVVHTIAFDVSENSNVARQMRDCAGNGGEFHPAENGRELADAFKKIGLALLNLRLSK